MTAHLAPHLAPHLSPHLSPHLARRLAGLAWRCLLPLLLVLGAPQARAHELSIAEMNVMSAGSGTYVWSWVPGERVPETELRPRWPDGCIPEDNRLRCGEDGLRGELGVDGLGGKFSAAVVRVRWPDGQSRVYTLTPQHPSVRVHGAAEDPRGAGEIASAYLAIGVEHILTGYDHLAFVLGLLFLVGFSRRLVWTITAFTLAHSLTLALSAFGLLVLRPPPVEATIALSIMLVAGEALHRRPTWSRRWPALVALLFGLVHGLGFAGALAEYGLPPDYMAIALLTFNLGVEAGQLLVIAGAWLLCRAFARWPVWPRLRTPALYGIGGFAAYWSIGRIAVMLG